MALSPDEIRTAVRSYQFVLYWERQEKSHFLMRWATRGGIMPLLCLEALSQIHLGAPYSYLLFYGSAAMTCIGAGLLLERKRRYKEAAVLMKIFEQDHPQEFEAIRQYQAEQDKKFGSFYGTNGEPKLAKQPAT